MKKLIIGDVYSNKTAPLWEKNLNGYTSLGKWEENGTIAHNSHKVYHEGSFEVELAIKRAILSLK